MLQIGAVVAAQAAIGMLLTCNNFTAGDAKSGQSTALLDITNCS